MSEKADPLPLPATERGKWKRRAALAAIGAVWIAAAIAGGLVGLFQAFGPAPMGRGLAMSQVVLDRNGKLLRAYLTEEGRWRLPATRDQVDPQFLEALFAYEDKRFLAHHGVDPLAFLRAAFQLATHGRIVSGGSTLTMQVARLLEPREHRSFDAKLRQTIRALQLEWALSKDEILALYLTLAPYGGNLEGVRAASFAYFGKEPRRLTLGEVARCSWRCRNRRNIAGPTVSRRRRSVRATACSTASRGGGCSATRRSRTPNWSRCRRHGSRCR
jgi:penicillin-binding protein 1C